MFGRMSQSLTRFGQSLEKVGKKMSEVGSWATMRLTLPILGLGAASIRTAGQNEQLAISLERFSNSAEDAEGYLRKLMQWANKTPFDMQDVVDAEVALRNAGYGLDEAAERRRMLGEIAAGSKKSLAEMTDAYLGMRLAGKVGASELHGMVMSNIPIVQELAAMLGVTDQRVYQLAENGKISFKQVRDAMRRMTQEGGAMFGKMERQGRSIFGVFTDLKRSIVESLGSLGSELYKSLEIADKVKRLSDFIRRMAEGFMALPQPIKDFITWTALIVAVLGPVLMIVGQVVLGIGFLSIGLGKLFGALAVLPAAIIAIGKAFVAGFPIIALITAAVIAFGTAGYMLVKHWDKVRAFFSELWGGVKEAFKGAIDFIMPYIDQLMSVVDKITSAFTRLKSMASDNPVTRGWNKVFGDEPLPANPRLVNAPTVPIGGMGGMQQVDAGGTIHVKIDSDGQPRVVEAKPNDRRMNYAADTGLLGGAY